MFEAVLDVPGSHGAQMLHSLKALAGDEMSQFNRRCEEVIDSLSE